MAVEKGPGSVTTLSYLVGSRRKCAEHALVLVKNKPHKGSNGSQSRPPPLPGHLSSVVLLLFFSPASECSRCVHTCPNKPSQMGNTLWFGNNVSGVKALFPSALFLSVLCFGTEWNKAPPRCSGSNSACDRARLNDCSGSFDIFHTQTTGFKNAIGIRRGQLKSEIPNMKLRESRPRSQVVHCCNM